MRINIGALLALPLVGILAVVALAQEAQPTDPALSAGSFTVGRADQSAYSEPAPVLDYLQQERFLRGRGHFNRRWVVFASPNGDWGLGPTFVADRCVACHVGTGRGRPPELADEQLLSLLVRISLPGVDEHGGPKPDPNYGDQLQNRALQGQSFDFTYSGEPVPEEAKLYLDWAEKWVRFADGEQIALRVPKLRIEDLHFGALGAGAMTSLRMAQPLVGLGLLEAVPERTILRLADQQKTMGFNGRANYVWDAVNGRIALGRFGWKANQPSIKQQIAAAALGDMGITSDLYPEQNCPSVQEVCRIQVPGNTPELIRSDWEELEFWVMGLAVPARRNTGDAQVQRGEKLFAQAKCAVCHVPEMTTGDTFPPLPQLTRQTFHAYTDLLLHDMGDELADHRPDFNAGGRDWRTQPLWGLGLSSTVSGSTAMLHDGRARNAAEAILWHGGEAQESREAFTKMPKADRDALLKFLDSI